MARCSHLAVIDKPTGLLFAECAINTSGNPTATSTARIEDANKKQWIGTCSYAPKAATKLRISVRIQAYGSGVVGGFAIRAGVAHEGAGHLRDRPSRTASSGSIDDELLDIERSGSSSEVDTRSTATRNPGKRTAVDVCADRVVHTLGCDNAGEALPTYRV